MSKSLTQEDIDNFYHDQYKRLLHYIENKTADIKFTVVFRNFFERVEEIPLVGYRVIFKNPKKPGEYVKIQRKSKSLNYAVFLAVEEFLREFYKELFNDGSTLDNLYTMGKIPKGWDVDVEIRKAKEHLLQGKIVTPILLDEVEKAKKINRLHMIFSTLNTLKNKNYDQFFNTNT